jgi:adenine-specific DNA methylase
VGGLLDTVRFIEGGGFPVDVVSRDAAIEMSFKPRPAYIARCKELGLTVPRRFYDPKIRSIHPWLARRSRSVARALNLASLLPVTVSTSEFLKMLGFSGEALRELVSKGYPPLISYTLPDPSVLELARDKIIVDPMAGGGSIPLEAVILGARTIACEYNPIAYLILKATIEYPAKYGLQLYRRVRDEVRRLIGFARTVLGEFYDEDVEGYIVLRRVKVDGKVVPLATTIPLTSRKAIVVKGSITTIIEDSRRRSLDTNRGLLPLWMKEHTIIMEREFDIEALTTLHTIVVVQAEKGFRLAGDRDVKLLLKAYEKYWQLKSEGMLLPSIPLAQDNEVFKDILPLGRYSNLFNPRQALATEMLIRYTRGRVRELVEREGDFGVAVGLYLALGLDRVVDFNSILTTWNYEQGSIRDSTGSYYKFRKFRLEGVYAEAIVPFKTLDWVFEPDVEGETAGGICPVLGELCEKLEGKGGRVEIYLADVLELSKHLDIKADVVNVDPPYYDQHVYSDFSEFFWPFLKTVLDDVIGRLFNNNLLDSWAPTSWRVPKEHEVISRRPGDTSFKEKFKHALVEMSRILKDDGLLVLWFNHRSLDAWKTVVDALQNTGFRVVNVIPLVSEHPTRSVTKGGTTGLSHVLVLVARKSGTQLPHIDKDELRRRALEWAKKAKLFPSYEVREEDIKVLNQAVEIALRTTK